MIINYRNIQSEDDWNWISKRADPTLTENTKGIVAVDTKVENCGNATIPSDNAKSLKLSSHIGLDVVHTIKDGFNKGVDYILMEMRKENCKWLKGVSNG